MHPGRHAASQPDHIAQVMAGSGATLTYRQLDERSNRFAHLLYGRGLRRGDHIAVLMENNEHYLELYWAALRSGLYITPVNRYLTAEEAAYIVGDCEAKVLVASAALGDVVERLLPLIPDCPGRLIIGDDVDGYQRYEATSAEHPSTPLDEQPLGDVMFYSSGTTGRPKGIFRPLTDRTIDDDTRGRIRSDLLGMGPDAVYLSTAPLYHTAALGYAAAAQGCGGTTVVMEHFDALDALRCIADYRVTHSQWVPTMFTRLLRLPVDARARYDLSSHRLAFHGAAPCPVAVKRSMIEWWGPILLEYYGATEGNGLTLIDSTEWLAHEGSVGRPVMGTLHVCDDAGRELGTGEEGLVYFEMPAVPFEYFHDAGKTQASRHPDHPTWSTLGDIGRVDADGYLSLTDRKDFMIISGGVNVYPAESENVLLTHPNVADVAVVGVPDAEMGEAVKAVVELTDGTTAGDGIAAELIDFCRQRLAHYKCPRTVDFVDELPRLPTGKLYKRPIRDRYWPQAESA